MNGPDLSTRRNYTQSISYNVKESFKTQHKLTQMKTQPPWWRCRSSFIQVLCVFTLFPYFPQIKHRKETVLGSTHWPLSGTLGETLPCLDVLVIKFLYYSVCAAAYQSCTDVWKVQFFTSAIDAVAVVSHHPLTVDQQVFCAVLGDLSLVFRGSILFFGPRYLICCWVHDREAPSSSLT